MENMCQEGTAHHQDGAGCRGELAAEIERRRPTGPGSGGLMDRPAQTGGHPAGLSRNSRAKRVGTMRNRLVKGGGIDQAAGKQRPISWHPFFWQPWAAAFRKDLHQVFLNRVSRKGLADEQDAVGMLSGAGVLPLGATRMPVSGQTRTQRRVRPI